MSRSTSRRDESAVRKTQTVNSDDREAEQPDELASSPDDGDANVPEHDGDVEELTDGGSVGADDIAWPVPKATMIPLALALSGLMVWAFGFDWVLISVIPFVVFLSAMTVIDLRELRIPNKLTQPAALAALPLLSLSLLTDWSDVSLLRALLGALAMGGFYFLLFFIYPAGMGFGDVKLAPIIGAQLGFFGWIPEVRGVIAAYLIVGPVAILLLILGRARMKSGFPFGPFMAAGAIVALVLEGRGR
jgi:prepilin signal peptidase PulO-like enzyme (type II secretory pathway)